MTDNEMWDYCEIKYTTYHNFGGGEHAGLNLGLLWFVGRAEGPGGPYEAGKSPEVPFGRAGEGVPDRTNPTHHSLHQQLVDDLLREGWQLLPERGPAWWQRRFKRKARARPRSWVQRIFG